MYSATLNEEEIDVKEDDENEDPRSRRDDFLKSMAEKLDLSDPQQKERYLQVKNRILEKVKATKTSRSRSRSVSSVTSIASKRALSGDKEGGKSPVRPKLGTKLPVKA